MIIEVAQWFRFIEKLIFAHLVRNISISCVIRGFDTVFIRNRDIIENNFFKIRFHITLLFTFKAVYLCVM
jgi:hypothetical protein